MASVLPSSIKLLWEFLFCGLAIFVFCGSNILQFEMTKIFAGN